MKNDSLFLGFPFTLLWISPLILLLILNHRMQWRINGQLPFHGFVVWLFILILIHPLWLPSQPAQMWSVFLTQSRRRRSGEREGGRKATTISFFKARVCQHARGFTLDCGGSQMGQPGPPRWHQSVMLKHLDRGTQPQHQPSTPHVSTISCWLPFSLLRY